MARIVALETSQNHVDQYRRQNNIVLFSIPDDVADNQLESTMILILSDIEVTMEPRLSQNWEVRQKQF